VATDFSDHCLAKLRAVQHYYGVSFDFVRVGLLYDVGEQLRKRGYGGFDLINLSGLLYHVFSPLLVLCAIRPLLKRNGLLVVSTNVVHDASFTMEFNNAGRLQSETNTFWYPSIPLLDYLLRYLKLRPIDCLYLPHKAIESSVRYVFDKQSGYLAVVCRAADTVLPSAEDGWMSRSERESWEHQQLVRWDLCAGQPVSDIRYGRLQGATLRHDGDAIIDLWHEVQSRGAVVRAIDPQDSHVLSLTDTR